MKTLKNASGDIYYMTEETKGEATCTEYTEIYLYSEELGEDYGTHYRNAVNGPQPNVWTPYKLTDKELVVYDDFLRRLSYKFTIID